ncbi:MAG: hypothetical protein LBU32_30035 [Clostridiales bacterium]|nr:hypothetical protein [Clostridiales bacterium]
MPLCSGAPENSFESEASVRSQRDPARQRKHTAEYKCIQKNRIEIFLRRTGFKLLAFQADALGADFRNLPNVPRKKGGYRLKASASACAVPLGA